MKTVPTTDLSSDEIRRIAAHKLEEAEAMPEGPLRQEALRAAHSLSDLADMKRWLASTELQAPRN